MYICIIFSCMMMYNIHVCMYVHMYAYIYTQKKAKSHLPSCLHLHFDGWLYTFFYHSLIHFDNYHKLQESMLAFK